MPLVRPFVISLFLEFIIYFVRSCYFISVWFLYVARSFVMYVFVVVVVVVVVVCFVFLFVRSLLPYCIRVFCIINI